MVSFERADKPVDVLAEGREGEGAGHVVLLCRLLGGGFLG
jgi:hypothetical protein